VRQEETFDDDLAWAEAALLIAASTDGRLQNLTEECEARGVRPLGPSAMAVQHVTDRMGLTLALAEAGLPTPRSWVIDVERTDLWKRVTGRIGFPVVIKSLTGPGGRGVQLVATPDALPTALQATAAMAGERELLLQEYLPGVAAGVGLVVSQRRAAVLGLWGALLSEPPGMTVERVATPFDHDGAMTAVRQAIAAAQAIPGLAGCVEVDLVFSPSGPVIIGLSPQPGLGTLALRRSRQFNLAALILDASLGGRLPDTRFWPPERPVMIDLAHPALALAPEAW
jgi:predicted ATP-grasp superfamily ATP-dependent carboligase